MFAQKDKKFRYRLISWILVFAIVLPLVVPVLATPRQAKANMPVINPVAEAREATKAVFEQIKEVTLKLLKQLVAVTFKNILGYITTELARYAAEYVISGDQAQKPAFFDNPGEYFLNMADTVSAEFVNDFAQGMTDDTIDLCKPMDPTIQFSMSLNLFPIEQRNEYQPWNSDEKCSWADIQKNTQEAWDAVASGEFFQFSFEVNEGPPAQYEEGLENAFVNMLNQDPAMNIYLVDRIREGILEEVDVLTGIQQSYRSIMDEVTAIIEGQEGWDEDNGEEEEEQDIFPNEESILAQMTQQERDILDNAKQEIGVLLGELGDHKNGSIRAHLNELSSAAGDCMNESLNIDQGTGQPKRYCERKTIDGIRCWAMFLNINSEDTCVNQEMDQTLQKSVTETDRYVVQINDWHSRLEFMMMASQAHITEGVENIGPNFVSLADTKKLFDSKGNNATVAMGVKSAMFQKQAEQLEESKFFRELQGGMNAVTSTISGIVKSPAEIIRTQVTSSFEKAGAKEMAWTGEILADAVSTFTSTLMNKLMEEIIAGLNPQADNPPPLALPTLPVPPGGFGSVPAGSAGPRPGTREAKASLASTFVSKPRSVSGSFNILHEFSICPDQYAGLNNCVVDQGFLMAAQRGLTVREALEEEILHGDWLLIPPTDKERNQDSKCFSYAYCHGNLAKMRQARILPIGWEIAAAKSEGRNQVTLQQAVDAFSNVGPDGQAFTQDDPFYHLIDPNWVIKAPSAQCRAMAYGELLQSDRAPSRQEICVDMPTCINEDGEGNCGGTWGYCTREKNIWRFEGDQCPSRYDTCSSFSRTSDSASFQYLASTLDFDSCDSDTAKGCRWYCDEWMGNRSAWGCYWNDSKLDYDSVEDVAADSGSRIFLNGNVGSCDQKDWGCREFLQYSGAERGETESYFAAVQADEEKDAAYEDYGFPQSLYMKKAPDYMGCYDEDPANDSLSCADFTAKCTRDEVGCEEYSPTSGEPPVPGLITEYDTCPLECAGYKNYKEMPTNFDTGRDPVSLIASTGRVCPVSDVGCEEFTNLDVIAAGGEGLEYYTYIRQCQKPAVDCSPFYTWVGSDTSGYQLKVYNLKTDPYLPGTPAVVEDLALQECASEEDAINNPGCKEFYAPDGTVSYRIYKNTISCSENCHPLRKTTQISEDLCEDTGGNWEGAEGAEVGTCLYMAIPSEGLSCSASSFGCREYKGNASYNINVVLQDDFEEGTNAYWEGGTSSNESTEPFQHSLSIDGTASKAVAVGAGKSYLLTFMAKGGDSVYGRLVGQSGTLQLGGITSSSEWRAYALGPIYVSRNDEYSLQIAGTGTYYIDNVEVSEVLDRVYLIKDSWNTPDSCNSPEEGFYLGCEEYEDRTGATHYLKSFSRICREAAVGCQALINTQNTASPYESAYNADTCALPSVCESLGGCSCTKQGESAPTCVVDEGEISCFAEDEDTAAISRDEVNYLVVDAAYSCEKEAKGCDRLGLPEIEAQSGEIKNYKNVYLVNDPDIYASTDIPPTSKPILCQESENGCAEYAVSGGGIAVFKDPKGRVCEYRENVNVGGELRTGWFKKGKDEPCYSNYGIRKSKESFYKDWVGECPHEMTGCSLFIDPQGSATEGVVSNGDFELPEERVSEYTDVPEKWQRKGDVGEYEFSEKGVEYIAGGGGESGYRIYTSAVKAVYNGLDDSVRQVISLKPDTFYKVSVNIKHGGDAAPAGVVLSNCVSVSGKRVEGKTAEDFLDELEEELIEEIGEEAYDEIGQAQLLEMAQEKMESYYGGISSPNESMELDSKEIHTRAWIIAQEEELSGTQYSYFEGQFHSGSAIECTVGFGSQGAYSNDHGHWFDNVDIREIGQYYYINNKNLDKKSCNGQVSAREGCVLFNDTSDPNLSYNSLATYAKAAETEAIGKAANPIDCLANLDSEYCKKGNQDSNDTNVIIKVSRDRACGQWLACRSSITVFDSSENKTKEICEQLGLCDQIKTEGEKSGCGHWVENTNPVPLTSEAYAGRDVSWSGMDYTGHSIPDKYPLQTLSVANVGIPGYPNYVLTRIEQKEEDEFCADGGEDYMGVCIYGPGTMTEGEDPIDASIGKSCRGYPEEDSPFSVEATGDYLEEANKCESVLVCLGGSNNGESCESDDDCPSGECAVEDCDCSYKKAVYGIGGSKKKYYNADKSGGSIPLGICQGGRDSATRESLDGEVCRPEEDDCNTSSGGTCLALEEKAVFYGWEGFCLEKDLSRPIYHDEAEFESEYPCLTWLPVTQITGGTDIFNQFKDAGFQMPEGKNEVHYCAASDTWGWDISREEREDYRVGVTVIVRDETTFGDCPADKFIGTCSKTWYGGYCTEDYDTEEVSSGWKNISGDTYTDGCTVSYDDWYNECAKSESTKCEPEDGEGWYLFNGLDGPETSAGGAWEEGGTDNSIVKIYWNSSTAFNFQDTLDDEFNGHNLELDESRCKEIIEFSLPTAHTDRTWPGTAHSLPDNPDVSFSAGCGDYGNFGEMTSLTDIQNQTIVLDDSQQCRLTTEYWHPNAFTYQYRNGSEIEEVENPKSRGDVAVAKNETVTLNDVKSLFVKGSVKVYSGCEYSDNTGQVIYGTCRADQQENWDRRQQQVDHGPIVAALDDRECDQSGRCAEGRRGSISIDSKTGYEVDSRGKYDGDILGENGSKGVAAKFYAWASSNQMPLTRIFVNWGDGTTSGGTVGMYMNHRGYHDHDNDPDTPKEGCSVEEQGFGGLASSCAEEYFIYNHDYSCGGPGSVSYVYCDGAVDAQCFDGDDPIPCEIGTCRNADGDIVSCANGCWDRDANGGFGACVYKPRVQLKDNWEYCTETSYRCSEGDPWHENDGGDGWSEFKGKVVITQN